MILLKRFDVGVGKGMRKAAHPWGGADSSNPRCWRGWRLHHHGGVFVRLVVLFMWFLTRDSSVGLVVPTF